MPDRSIGQFPSFASSRAAAYLRKVPTPGEGQRNDALNSTGYALLERFDLSQADFEALMLEWIAPTGLPLAEVGKTLLSVWAAAHAKGVVGSKARRLPAAGHNGNGQGYNELSRVGKTATLKLRPPHFDLESPADLPEPIDDGARRLIETAFLPGEHIRIAPAIFDDKGDEIPDGAGVVLKREEWLAKLNRVNGRPNGPNGLWTHTQDGRQPGMYVGINPMRPGGTKDAEVASLRHVLVEFDEGLSPEEQFAVYLQANLPTSAIIFSGGKSVHAWVRVDASDRQEYAARADVIYQHLAAAGLPVDKSNRNPGRLSRLPAALRLGTTQELLRLNTGALSFAAWLADAQAEGIGTLIGIDRLLAWKADSDQNNLIGQRWLCRGGSALLVGPSGVGKSSLVLQFAVGWAVGLPVFGIAPVRPLRSLLMQAEDDEGDLAEMLQGITTGLGLDAAQVAMVRERLVIIRDAVHTGQQFAAAIEVLIKRHQPDLVIFNPLLSFIGEDISRQEVCSQFLRGWLGPIAEATGVAWLAVHHTGKPMGDPKARKHWQGSDWGYAGLGSSELTNWARAIMVLRHVDPGTFHLRLAKRGNRALATHPDGTTTNVVWIQHQSERIYWRQIQPAEEPASVAEKINNLDSAIEAGCRAKKGGRPSKLNALLSRNLEPFLAGIPTEGEPARNIGRRLIRFGLSGKPALKISDTLARTEAIEQLLNLGKLKFNAENDLYSKA